MICKEHKAISTFNANYAILLATIDDVIKICKDDGHKHSDHRSGSKQARNN